VSSIEEIKARINIVDLVSETVQLRRSGRTYTGFCPFHENARTPAFAVWPESGTWRCFGQCNEGGDIFKFVMKRDGVEFNEALKILAEKAGVQLRPPTPQEKEAAETHARLRQLLEEAVTFYRHQLLTTPLGQQSLAYLRQRGIQDATMEIWGLGYAPNTWDSVRGHFQAKGYSEAELLEAGLVTQREGGGVYDRFRGRIMIPIRDEHGHMAGFGARITNPDDIPKFLNSPQTPIFDKGRLLFGLDRARRSIRDLDQVVIVEGYLDVIALHQAGFANAVSPMGTALTENQIHLLKRFTHRIVMALDPDAAGVQATLRGLQIARQAMDHTQEVVFDARGLIGHEARLQADIRITTLPDGMDPDDVVNRSPAEWQQIVENAQPVVVHVMETLAHGRDLDDAKVRREIASQVMPLIEDVSDAVERDSYRQRLARVLHVDERTLQTTPRTRPISRRPGRAQSVQGQETTGTPAKSTQEMLSPASAAHSSAVLESRSLGILMRRPDLLFRVDRRLQESGLQRVCTDDFQSAENQALFQVILQSLEQDLDEPLSFVLNGLSLPIMDRADEALQRTETLDPVEERVLEDLSLSILRLRRRQLVETLDYYRYLQEEAQAAHAIDALEYGQAVLQQTRALHRLDQAIGRLTSRTASNGN
jgi:DNA primase